MIILDSSAVIEVLLRTPAATTIEKRIFAPGEILHAPHLLDAEVTQVVRRYALTGDITPGMGRAALEDLIALPVHRHAHDFLLSRVWELRNNLSAYDAMYVALAEVLDAPLITRDGRLARTKGHKAHIHHM